MKKFFIAIIFSLISTYSFAGVFLSADIVGIGPEFEMVHNSFDVEKPNDFSAQFYSMSSFNFTLGYEFFTRSVKPDNHWYVAGNVGFMMFGLNGGLSVGMTHKLFEAGPFRFELDPALEIGQISGIKGGVWEYFEPSVSMLALFKKRTGLYGSFGIAFPVIYELATFKDYGYIMETVSAIHLKMLLGVRF